MSSPAGVSVVIPTFRREDALDGALRAVVRAAAEIAEPVEAIVVDDEPRSGIEPSTRELDGVPVRRFRTVDSGAHGPAAARNVGIAAARFDVTAFTDDDCRPDVDWLRAGLARLRSDPDLAGVEGAVRVDLTGTLDPVRARLVSNERGGGFLTASLFVRTDAARAVGGFRRLLHGGAGWAIPYREDTDFGLRVRDQVGPVPFAPDAFVWHRPEHVNLRRLVSLARYFVVDGAFIRLHPDAVPSVWRHPLARFRIRGATCVTLLFPLLLAGPLRRWVTAAITLLVVGLSAHTELELRQAGARRSTAAAVRDIVRRLPRTLAWALAAGGARLQGEAIAQIEARRDQRAAGSGP